MLSDSSQRLTSWTSVLLWTSVDTPPQSVPFLVASPRNGLLWFSSSLLSTHQAESLVTLPSHETTGKKGRLNHGHPEGAFQGLIPTTGQSVSASHTLYLPSPFLHRQPEGSRSKGAFLPGTPSFKGNGNAGNVEHSGKQVGERRSRKQGGRERRVPYFRETLRQAARGCG